MVSYFFVEDRGRSFNSRKLSHFIKKIEEKGFGACPWVNQKSIAIDTRACYTWIQTDL